MAQTQPPVLDPLPQAPNQSQPTGFATVMDTFLAALVIFRTQIVAFGLNLYNNAVDAYQSALAAAASALASANSATAANLSAQAADASAQAAAIGSNAPKWVAGPYADGVIVWSPSNRKRFAKVGAAVSNVDPALDNTGAWTSPVDIPGTGSNTANVAAGSTLVLSSAGAMVQNLTPLGPGASMQFPPASAMQAAVAAAYACNQGVHQLGVRDGSGVLKQVMPAGGAAAYTLADVSSAAGRWDYLVGGDDGILSFFDAALPSGWSYLTFRPNLPASTGEIDKTFLVVSPTLIVCLVVQGASVGLLAFNPVTGAISSVQTLTASYSTDSKFMLVKMSATTVGVFWGQAWNTPASARVAGKLISFDAALVAGVGATALVPAGGFVFDEINALVLSGGAVAIAVRGQTASQPYYTGFAVAGLTLTPGGAPSQFGTPVPGTGGAAPQMTEVGPNCFAVAGIPTNGSNAYVITYSINNATGVVAAAATSPAVPLGAGYATPGQASVVQLPGTTKYIAYWPQTTGTAVATAFTHIFNITTAGAISVINGQAGPNTVGGYYLGNPGYRLSIQGFGGPTPGIVVPHSAASGSVQPQYSLLSESTGTPGTVAYQPNKTTAQGVGAELQSPTPGTWYLQFGTNSLYRVTYNSATGAWTQTLLGSFSSSYGTIYYGNVVNGIPVIYGSNNYVASKRGTKFSAINTTPTGGFVMGQSWGSFESLGNYIVFPDTSNKKIRVMEIAQ